jgi:glycosyltransferase involved in cell wall biosynthesis
MHIGFDAKRFFHNETGLGTYSRQIVKALAEANLSITLFEANPKSIDWLADYPNIQVRRPEKKQSFWRQYGIARDVHNSGVDIFHGLSAELPLSKINLPKVVTIHDVIYEKYPRLYTRADRMIYRQKTKWACKQADAVVAISKKTTEDLRKRYGIDESKVFVIPPYTEQVKQPFEGRDRKHILCLSQFEERKNHMALVRAYKRASEQKDLPPLVLAGKPGKTLQTVLDYLDKEQLSDKVSVRVNVSEAEKQKLLSQSLYMVFPSFYEGYGIPVVEAMNASVPVVVAEDSSMQEIVGESGFLFDPTSPLSLDNLLLKIDKQALARKEKIIPLELEKCSKQVVVRKHVALYHDLFTRLHV